MIGHYVFHVGFILSCVALVAAIMNPDAASGGLAGQPIEQTPFRRGITLLVFTVMVVGFGSGVLACIRRDARCRRIHMLKKQNQEAANNTSELTSGGRADASPGGSST